MKEILTVISAGFFIIANVYLAKSIEFQADTLSKLNGELAKRVKEMGSPGRTNKSKLYTGMVLNSIGYGLLIISTIC